SRPISNWGSGSFCLRSRGGFVKAEELRRVVWRSAIGRSCHFGADGGTRGPVLCRYGSSLHDGGSNRILCLCVIRKLVDDALQNKGFFSQTLCISHVAWCGSLALVRHVVVILL